MVTAFDLVSLLGMCIALACGLLILWRAFATSVWWGLGILVPVVGQFLFAVVHWRRWSGPAAVATAAIIVACGAQVGTGRLAATDFAAVTVASLGYFGFVWVLWVGDESYRRVEIARAREAERAALARIGAAVSLGSVPGNEEVAGAMLRDLLGSPSGDVQRAASRALAALGSRQDAEPV